MESSLIANALQVNFDSVLGFPDNDGIVNMFKALESTGLRGFLGCPSVLYEQALEQFFDTAFDRENEVVSAVQGKFVGISEEQFSGVFELPMIGLTDVADVPKDLVYHARSIFSKSGEPVKTSCKKRKMKYEFHLLNDILEKSVTVKAGSFDAVTHEQFLLMTTIHFGLKIIWSKFLFDILKEMVTKSFMQAKGFAAQVCVLLKRAPNLTLGEAKTFPPQKILNMKTVGTYVAKNKISVLTRMSQRNQFLRRLQQRGDQLLLLLSLQLRRSEPLWGELLPQKRSWRWFQWFKILNPYLWSLLQLSGPVLINKY
ncbi:hypothetical protein F511_30145 [Dorcoceras hygrometricum]|uniref:Dystroglycan-like n=1 Tax=Dorcoceras hygrometricum TaxID=472368 RepID=A0A2Z7CMS9_9LAMI|nr:hypothetical protein F511_30145 [Dorcoceras hygrometricum]